MRRARTRTIVRSILQAGIGDETDSGMETLRIAEAVHDHVDLLAPELGLDALERTLETEPEVDFLGGRAGGDVAIELGDGLNGLDPGVYVRVQRVEEAAVVEEFRWDV